MRFSRDSKFGIGFLNYLIEFKGLKDRSSSDVLSHLNRVSSLILLFQNDSDQLKLEFDLEVKLRESDYSTSVKSHLRRALRLY